MVRGEAKDTASICMSMRNALACCVVLCVMVVCEQLTHGRRRSGGWAQGKHDELHDGTVQFLACREQVADWGSGVHVYLEFFDLQHAAAQAAAAADGGGGAGGDGWAAVNERCAVLLTELEQADRKWGDGLQHGPSAAAGDAHTPVYPIYPR